MGVLVLCGCQKSSQAVYRDYASRPVAVGSVSPARNAFDDYAAAAEEVELKAGKNLTRVSFYPAQRAEAEAACASPVLHVLAATDLPCKFKGTPRSPLTGPRYESGWRLIGRCLAWRIEKECIASDFGHAVSDTLASTRFGFDLTGGSATDASTGLSIVDSARRAIAPYLPMISSSDLLRLEIGLKSALARKPSVDVTIEQELADSMVGVQELQEAYRNHELPKIQKLLGSDSAEPIAYLEDLAPEDPKRVAFFDGLAAHVTAWHRYAHELSKVLAFQRPGVATPALPTEHAWRRLARFYCGAGTSLLLLNDTTISRTRLMIVEAEMERRRKIKMPLPDDLRGFGDNTSIDPFSGRSFIYHHDSQDFRVYSVGADGQDDLGQTDPSYTAPDMWLERPR